MVWLESSEPTADEIDCVRGLSFLKVVVVSGRYVYILHWMLKTCSDFSHFKISILIDIGILICFMNNAWIFPFEFGSVLSVLRRFWSLSILLILLTDLSDLPIDFGVHVVVLVLDWIQRLVVRADSCSYLVSLVVAV